jgi:hypothetical protein
MNVRSAVLSLLSIRHHQIQELIEKLPYSRPAIYATLNGLTGEGLIEKRRERGRVIAELSDRYEAQKLREIYIKSLSSGIDPDILLRESTLNVWRSISIEETKSLKEIKRSTGLSYNWVRKIVGFLLESNLAVYKKRKPVLIVMNKNHEVNKLLKRYTSTRKEDLRIYYSGTIPFEIISETPEMLEKLLYQKIDEGFSIKGTGLLVRGKEKLSIMESTEKELTNEESFLKKIETLEGVEDLCIRLIESEKIDYDKLLELAGKRNMINMVGCYLDILNSIKKVVPASIIKKFMKNISKRRTIFLKPLKRYGKEGWEKEFEEKWNVNLYLDIGAIRHGMGSI